MPGCSDLTTAQILTAFAEEIAARGGRTTEALDDGHRLFARSVLPHVERVRADDRVQGGVALKATTGGVWLYPYLFRLVCLNGAIIAETLGSRSLGDLHEQEAEGAVQSIREGVDACCAQDVFLGTVARMRKACEVQVDFALNMMPLLSGLPTVAADAGLLSRILDLFFREGDRSQFGLANAITAVARDTRDPDLRWDLEELGGGIAVGAVPQDPANEGRTAMARLGQAVAAG